MSRFFTFAGALALTLLPPVVTLAQFAPPARTAAPAPVYQAAPPAYHAAAPVYHAAPPAYHPVPAPAPPASTIRYPATLERNGLPLPHDVNLHPAPSNATGFAPHSTLQANPTAIPNPYGWRGWAWNHGVIWYPIPYYWGYGFWGPWGLLATPTMQFGSVTDYQSREIYPSYGVGPESPGGELLYDYGLEQTECGPPNLVVIWGPDKSVICAYPNSFVPSGNYQADPATLTLHPQ